MTLVIAMKFSKTHGAMIADERVCDDDNGKKFDIEIKIRELLKTEKILGLIGGSGTSESINETIRVARESAIAEQKQIRSGYDLALRVSKAAFLVKHQIIDEHLYKKYGLLEINYQTGKRSDKNGQLVDIDETLWDALHEEYKSKEVEEKIDNAFLTLTYGADGICIYRNDMGEEKPREVTIPYDTITSDDGASDDILSRFVKRIPRKERGTMDYLKCIRALLQATDKASSSLTNIGGTPLIKIVQDGDILDPDENNVHLAMDVVKGVKEGYLPEGFDLKCIDSLLYQRANFRAVEQEMWQMAGSKRDDLNLYLRGYRV